MLDGLYATRPCVASVHGCDSLLHCTAGELWELDGRRAGPVSHGPLSGAGLLHDSARVAKQFMQRCVCWCAAL